MTRIIETERREIDRRAVVALQNVGNNNPWPRHFTLTALETWPGTLEELWHLSSHSYAPTRSSWDHPYTEDSIAMMRENVEFLQRDEPIWTWQRFKTSPSWQSWGIGRRIGNRVHFRSGTVETVYNA